MGSYSPEELRQLRAAEALLKNKDAAARQRAEVTNAFGLAAAPAAASEPRTIGKSVADSIFALPGYEQAVKSGGEFTLPAVEVDFSFGRKANESATSAGVPAEAYVPGIVPLRDAVADGQMPTLLDVLPSRSVSSNIVRYVKETTSTNASTSVAELGAIPQSVSVLADSSVTVEKVGTYLLASDEILADFEGAREFFDQRLAGYVRAEAEDQVINGDGSTPNLNGFLQAVTQTQPLGADTYADCFFKAGTDVRSSTYGVEPTHILLHPTDFQTAVLAKDATDAYIMDGARSGGAPFWGMTPLVSQRIASGTAMVGAFGNREKTELAINGGLSVQLAYSGSGFTSGIVTIRATMRLALMIYDAGAFSEITGLV